MSTIPGTQPSPQKIYPGSADANSIGVFDMSINDTSMYGTYSVGPSSTHVEGVSAANYIDPDLTFNQDMYNILLSTVHAIIPDGPTNAGALLDKNNDHLNGGDF
jgi:hypothetical protein